MADNYLEYRQQEIAEAQRKRIIRKGGPSLDSLLRRNRSYRTYDNTREITEKELRELVKVTTLVASGMNRQVLRYRLVTAREASKVLPLITLGAALPEERLPHPGQEPLAFIVICTSVPESKVVDIDLGIAAQSILLKATEMGLGGLFILNFQKASLREALALSLEPLAVVAIGKPAESVFIMPVPKEEKTPDLNYYRKDGNHYVPKLSLEHILL